MTHSDTDDTSTTEGGNALDRRRAKLRKTQEASGTAATAVNQLDERLGGNAKDHRDYEAALQTALDQVAALKKAIKAAKKEGVRLQDARKKARGKAAKTQQRSATAEKKYDRAVLADMLRREKNRDLSAHSATNGQSDERTASGAVSTSGRSVGDDLKSAADTANTQDADSVHGGAGVENATSGSDSARETAARTTAGRARSTTTRSARGQARHTESSATSSASQRAGADSSDSSTNADD